MKTSSIIWLILLSIIFVLLGIMLWFTITLKEAKPGNCDNIMKSQPDVLWKDNCSYIEEKHLDETLKTPSDELYLTRFTPSSSLGPPLGANVWYRYRYVRGKTGGYSKFSPWTKSAIIAGSNTLPCKDSDCSNMSKHGKDSCSSNLVTVEVENIDYDRTTGIYANVHKVVLPSSNAKPPKDSDKSEIVGVLNPEGFTGWSFIDITESPCKKITCNRPGC